MEILLKIINFIGFGGFLGIINLIIIYRNRKIKRIEKHLSSDTIIITNLKGYKLTDNCVEKMRNTFSLCWEYKGNLYGHKNTDKRLIREFSNIDIELKQLEYNLTEYNKKINKWIDSLQNQSDNEMGYIVLVPDFISTTEMFAVNSYDNITHFEINDKKIYIPYIEKSLYDFTFKFEKKLFLKYFYTKTFIISKYIEKSIFHNIVKYQFQNYRHIKEGDTFKYPVNRRTKKLLLHRDELLKNYGEVEYETFEVVKIDDPPVGILITSYIIKVILRKTKKELDFMEFNADLIQWE